MLSGIFGACMCIFQFRFVSSIVYLNPNFGAALAKSALEQAIMQNYIKKG